MNVQKKLLAVQAELKAPKGQKNEFGGYRYRSLEDIVEAAKPLLKKEGLVLLITDELVELAGEVYIKATASVMDNDGENIGATAYAREAKQKKGMDPAQITGAASSYARKYACNGLFAIDDTRDPDTEKPQDYETGKSQSPQETKDPETEKSTTFEARDRTRIEEAKRKLATAKTVGDLIKIFAGLPEGVRKSLEIKRFCTDLKKELETPKKKIDF